MVFRAGPGAVWKQIQASWLGPGRDHHAGRLGSAIKTCAWRQTFTCDISALSWSRSLGAQLASDAVGQFGFAGKLLGEGLRVSMVGATVPLADGISSSAIDGGLHTFTAAVVTVLGITVTLLLAPLPGQLASLRVAGRRGAHRSHGTGRGGRRKRVAADGERGESDWAIAVAL